MRIGIWNVENRLMSAEHEELLIGQDCDVWLLSKLIMRFPMYCICRPLLWAREVEGEGIPRLLLAGNQT